MPGQFEVMIERNFSSAHQLRGYRGKCENLHGHNYKIEIYARGRELNNIGLLVDFVELKEAADDLVTYLDHKNLNELEPFVTEQNPSAENVARFILKRLLNEHSKYGFPFLPRPTLRALTLILSQKEREFSLPLAHRDIPSTVPDREQSFR